MSMIGGAHERRRERRAAERAAAADQAVDVDASDMVDSAEGSATTGKVATEVSSRSKHPKLGDQLYLYTCLK